MKCPRCTGVNLNIEHYEEVEIDKCPDCRGVWLDRNELIQIISTEEEVFADELIHKTLTGASKGVPKSEQESVVLCPKCSSQMSATNYNYSSGIIIDSCPNGHGVWLDNKELEKVQINGEFWKNEEVKHSGEWNALAGKAYKSSSKSWDASHQDDVGISFVARILRKFL